MKLRHSGWIILCLVFIAFTLGCLFLPAEVERTTTASQIYSFDPSTILQFLTQGNTDVFILLPEEPDPIQEYTPVTWEQEDYLLVAEALHKYVRDESLGDWKLTNMVFRLECKEVSTGLQLGSFTFSKIIYDQEIPYRWVRNITIDPTDNVIFFTEEEYHREGNFTKIAAWPSVDLSQIKISAEDAIRIAEIAG